MLKLNTHSTQTTEPSPLQHRPTSRLQSSIRLTSINFDHKFFIEFYIETQLKTISTLVVNWWTKTMSNNQSPILFQLYTFSNSFLHFPITKNCTKILAHLKRFLFCLYFDTYLCILSSHLIYLNKNCVISSLINWIFADWELKLQ